MQVQFLGLVPDQLFTLAAAQLMAGRPDLTVEAAVSLAIDLAAESNVQSNSEALIKRVNERNPDFIAEQQAKIQAQQRGLVVPGGPIPSDLLKRNRQTQ